MLLPFHIAITITFGSPVVVSGCPQLALNSGGVATYTSGNGTNILTFTYLVQTGERTSRLDGAVAVPSLAMNLPGQVMSIQEWTRRFALKPGDASTSGARTKAGPTH